MTDHNAGCCDHWGLQHWFCGIKEYVIDRCLCFGKFKFNSKDENKVFESSDKQMYSDCCCVAIFGFGDCENYVYNNPIGGILCLPFAATMHLLCLPFACCSHKEENAVFGPTQRKNDAEQKARETQLIIDNYNCDLNYGNYEYEKKYQINKAILEQAYWHNSP